MRYTVQGGWLQAPQWPPALSNNFAIRRLDVLVLCQQQALFEQLDAMMQKRLLAETVHQYTQVACMRPGLPCGLVAQSEHVRKLAVGHVSHHVFVLLTPQT